MWVCEVPNPNRLIVDIRLYVHAERAHDTFFFREDRMRHATMRARVPQVLTIKIMELDSTTYILQCRQINERLQASMIVRPNVTLENKIETSGAGQAAATKKIETVSITSSSFTRAPTHLSASDMPWYEHLSTYLISIILDLAARKIWFLFLSATEIHSKI